MVFIDRNTSLSKIILLALSMAMALLLSACGGGGGSAGTATGGSTTTTTPTITLKLVNSSGVATNVVTESAPLTGEATVLDATGAPIANTVVTFSTGKNYTTLTPSSATALTNSKGVATITLTIASAAIAQTEGGTADVLTASATPSKTTITATAAFALGPDTSTAVPTMTLTLANSSGTASNLVTTSSPLTATATVLDASGNPLSNVLVNFKTGQSYTTLTPSSASILTNSSGVATITLSVASLLVAETEGGTGDVLTANATSGSSVLTATAPFTLGSTAVTLSLASTNGVTLNAYGSTSIKVNVSANGALYTATPVTVNFSSACVTSGKAVMASSANTVNGVAQVTYTDNGCSSTDLVTISVSGATSITDSVTDQQPISASIEFLSATPSDKAIVIQGAGGVTRVQTATLVFEVLDTYGNPLPNTTVNFSLYPTTAGLTLGAASAVTGADGKVTVSVTSGSVATSFNVIATLAQTPTITTISDTILVTTGPTSVYSISLSASPSHNIEGWGYDNVQTTLTILLADQNGNPVADGTPVVFATDSGAVGSSAEGGCVTANGGCSVVFRSQNPRYAVGNSAGKRAGLATVSVSTTSEKSTFTGAMGVYLSGSAATTNSVLTDQSGNVYSLTGSGPSLTNATVIPLSTCAETYFTLQLNDLNNNPLPATTTVAAAPSSQGTTPTAVMAANNPIFPATVTDRGPPNSTTSTLATVSGAQGSVHTFQFSPGGTSGSTTACKTVLNGGTAGAGTGQIQVTITTPKGIVSLINVNFTYPM
ncbi:MAG: Ig-like domain-containing protein [Burkholderiaceae bacterium]|nr:Ig-like domain-containing protein [Burkholderiaceae bacterium]